MVAMSIAITLSRIADRSHEGIDSVACSEIQAAVPVNQTLGPFTLGRNQKSKKPRFLLYRLHCQINP